MSKELEAFDRLALEHDYKTYDEYDNDYEIVKKALQSLESIDNANPSEALECLEEIGKTLMFTDYETLESKTLSEVMPNYYRKCEQALIKAQENEKVLSIIKEKRIDLESFYITFIEKEYHYNYYKIMYGTYGKFKLTQEEFDLLKGWLG